MNSDVKYNIQCITMLNGSVERRLMPSSRILNDIDECKLYNNPMMREENLVDCGSNKPFSFKNEDVVPNTLHYFHLNRRIYHQLFCFFLALSFFEKLPLTKVQAVSSHSASNNIRRTVNRPKITYASQDTQEALLQQPTIKAVCSNETTEEAGVMSLTYTFSVDWIPAFGTKSIIYNIEASLVDILSKKLLLCDESTRKRRHLKLESKEEVKPGQTNGIVAIDGFPEDKISQLSEFVI